MPFEQHAFISYAHVDNQTTPDDSRGWVTRFQQQLAAYLGTEIGSEPRLWRDERLRGTDVFRDEIYAQFPKTALLIAVVSPRYLESPWCLDELARFCAAASATGGIVVDSKTRIVRVLLKPIDADQRGRLPEALRADESLGYPFFEEVEGKRTLRLDPALGNGEAYRRNVMFLAEDIADVIRRLEKVSPAPAAAATPAAPVQTVYLAECGADRRADRERLRAELKAHGVHVLPEQRLPDLEEEYVAAVDALLERCQLAVHLVGSAYGNVPDGPGLKSNVVLQNECAIRRHHAAGLPRLIWLPQGTVGTVEPQAKFIEALRTQAALQAGADLIDGSLEVFKSTLHALLRRLREPAPAPPATGGLYLLCDEKDRKATVPLRRLLRERGIEATLPVFEGDAAVVREANQRQLAACRAVLLYYGAGGEGWKRSTDSELKKLLAARSGGAAPPVWTYLAEPASAHKDDLLDMEEPNLIDGRDGLLEARLAPLLGPLGTPGSSGA